ncbi:MAG: hypothetical protein M3454_07500 [Actinomycetota bacterium]|nr:hypothetical protein [Actinomycetota bacterium]
MGASPGGIQIPAPAAIPRQTRQPKLAAAVAGPLVAEVTAVVVAEVTGVGTTAQGSAIPLSLI